MHLYIDQFPFTDLAIHPSVQLDRFVLTLKAPNTTIAAFANTADPDETAHNEPFHLDLQCLPSKV